MEEVLNEEVVVAEEVVTPEVEAEEVVTPEVEVEEVVVAEVEAEQSTDLAAELASEDTDVE